MIQRSRLRASRSLTSLQLDAAPGVAATPAPPAAGVGAGGCTYRLELQTSSMRGAGTTGSVFLTLMGPQGAAGEGTAVKGGV